MYLLTLSIIQIYLIPMVIMPGTNINSNRLIINPMFNNSPKQLSARVQYLNLARMRKRDRIPDIQF
jgi:hypothetical protein